ncbi:NAD-dependent epimerase/dehydratase [Amycolatopsis lurida]
MAASLDQPLITVLGASGLLGTAITRELAGRAVRLRLVGRRRSRVPSGSQADVEVRTGDLTVTSELAEAVADADVVIHLVAHITGVATWRVTPGDLRAERVNLGLVHDLIRVIRAQHRDRPPIVVLAGSMSQAGRSATARIDGSEPDEPVSEYDRQKLAAERALEAATAQGWVRGTTLRLATLFSQGTDPTSLDRGVVASMTRRALAGEPLTMWHDGTVRRDLLCVDDAARAFAAAIDHADALAGRHWLVGTGHGTEVGELFHTIAKAVAELTGKPPVPVVSTPPTAYSSATDLLDFVLDPAGFARVSGWAPQVALSEALIRVATAVANESR